MRTFIALLIAGGIASGASATPVPEAPKSPAVKAEIVVAGWGDVLAKKVRCVKQRRACRFR